MNLNKLPKSTTRSKKRVGRGYGSGKGGHTAGRGAKGAKARGKIPLTFTGTKYKKSFLKRLPLVRGKGKFKSLKPGPVAINLNYLNLLPDKAEVTTSLLVKKKIVKEKDALRYGVKILVTCQVNNSLKVFVPCSLLSENAISKAGGSVVAQWNVTTQADATNVIIKILPGN